MRCAEVVYLKAAPSRYHLGERLGAGGLTEVFSAALLGAEGFSRAVAIKRIRSEFRHDEQLNQRFIRQALALARLCHPNIVSALNFERDRDGQLFLVLEFIEGVDLSRLIASGPLPPAMAIFIASEVLRGLQYAHRTLTERGDLEIVHRDLSSHSILLSWCGAVKVSSHASASLERQVEVADQAMPLDGRSDLFVVGIMLWGMLTGELLGRQLTDSIMRPGLIRPVPRDLEVVAMKLLERDPARRFPDAKAAFDAVIACEDASPLGSFGLERLLVERFPQQAPRRARPTMVPPPMAKLYRGPRPTETVFPPPRSLGGRWALFAAITACAAVGAFSGVVGGVAVAEAWRSGQVARGSASEGRTTIGVRPTCHTLESSVGALMGNTRTQSAGEFVVSGVSGPAASSTAGELVGAR